MMRIKKYVVNSLAEAMQEIKQDLGQDAVILDTKKVKKKGLLGLFRKKTQIEVIAAVDPNRSHSLPESFSKRREQNRKGLDGKAAAAALQPLKTQAVQNDVAQEIKELKTLMLNMMGEATVQLPPVAEKIDQQLRQHGVLPFIRADILQKLLREEKWRVEKGPHRELTTEARRMLKDYLATLPFQENKPLPKLVCFVGPTGVGKTTTIAKLAADMLLVKRRKVGLITADTYRIAAVEQLRTYAQILNVPLKVIYSRKDLTEALDELQDCDCILMDTAGRNYLGTFDIHQLKQFVPEGEDVETCLVLSLTSKYEDMKHVIANFKTLPVHSLILTKADETRSLGSIVNLLSEYRLPLAYITNGQNVPDDFLHPSPGWLADALLKEGVEHERSS
ncbi:flagellar biosynthetic protein FlhF [Caldalkalibacillus thermarum TA2.A1]|uniref:Flagellar biosynthesis protein FlhF n=2 Tax=Caldalkalibacillus TaxID=379065 RepID=F5L7Z8_CALTT|nr:flagellar biosynthetic protein FlhF [Caldalkalibacillus thermarum TA2.A1]QZT33006.1 flagellar biosynthesis protein FlhF [Caldalkalibacillus thermarum TA2.A1]